MKIKVSASVCVGFTLLFAACSFAQTTFNFRGEIDFKKARLNLTVDMPSAGNAVSSGDNQPSFITLNALKTGENDYHLSVGLDHVQTSLYSLLSKVESSIEIVNDPQSVDKNTPIILGKIRSRNSLIDYKPIRELSGRFEFKDSQLILRSLVFGDLTCWGSVDFVYPFKMDLSFFLHDIAMEDFLDFWVRDKQYKSFGTVSGQIDVMGTLSQLRLKGNLKSYNGSVEQLSYNSLELNAEGTYPRLRISPSLLSKAGGLSFTFSGPFDLSDTINFKKQISMFAVAPLVNDSTSQSEWTIKRWNRHKSRFTEIKYLLRKDDRAESESGLIGVAQTVSF